MIKTEPNIPCSHETLNLNKSPKKMKFKKSFYFWILRWMSFLMIPLTILYDDYIDGSKIVRTKKPFEYAAPPPTIGRNNRAEPVVHL